jgi:uncharacterized protein (DUF1015 family)
VPRPEGLVLSPFRALRFAPDQAGDLADLTSPPYDVLDDGAVTALEARSDANVVRLILPRAGAEDGSDRYQRAAALLSQWREQGVLRPDPEPALYVYEQADPASGHVQRGLLGALALSPAEDGVVLPHESTMAGPVADRLALYTAVGADLEPIFLVYDGGGAASHAVEGADAGLPLVDAVLGDGLRHRLWALTDPAQLVAVAEDLRPRTALIADGHHRYATYLQRQAERHERGDGAGPWDAGLCLLVDATSFGPQVHPIHRVVPGRAVAGLAEAAAAGAAVRRLEGDLDEALAELAAARGSGPAFLLSDGDPSPQGERHLLTELDPALVDRALPADRSRAWRELDVTLLHQVVVPHLWDLADDEASVGFEHDTTAALRRALATGGTAVLLGPTPVEAVASVARHGERMPRKSTLFTPKPRTGVVLRDHRDA